MSGVENILEIGLSVALAACAAWLALITLLMVVEALTTGRIHRTGRFAPRALRTIVSVVCGVGLASGVASVAVAEPAGGVQPVHLLDGLQLPDRTVSEPVEHSPDVTAVQHVVVRPGDSLWSIGERLEVPWQRLYASNRAVVGDDPDLIQPGMRLVVPGADAGDAR